VLPLNIPPLRERRGDIPEIMYYLRDMDGGRWELEEEAERFLEDYSWPGNIRELRNVVQYLDSLGSDRISLRDLPPLIGMRTRFKEEPAIKDIKDVPGAGAAGGLGGGFLAFLNSRLERGIEMVLDAIAFDDIIRGSDLVITGEGRVDSQTLTGKTPYGIMKRAQKQNIRTVAIGGSVKLGDDDDVSGFDSIWPVTPEGMPLEEAMKAETASANVRETVKKIMLEYKTEGNE
jgi:glycerate kinase